MMRFLKWIKAVYLFPIMLVIGNDGGDGGVLLGGDDGDAGGNNNDGSGDDLLTLFTPEEITAKRQAVITVKAEEERRAKLTDAEREAEDKAKADADKGNTVPEEYETFTLPDGMEMNKELLDKFLPIAKELKLTQSQAQKLVDIQIESTVASTKQWTETISGWATEAKKDQEFGGNNFDGNLAIAKSAVQRFGTPALESALKQYGFGNHPEMIRLMYRVGKAIKEDGLVMPGAGNNESGDRITSFYSKSNMNQ